MKSGRLGKTDISVSMAPLGAMFLGTKQDRDASFALLDLYRERGGNFIDSANIYAHWVGPQFHGGESEVMVGEWIKARGNRHDLVIASKVGFPYADTKTGLSTRQIKDACDKSLKRLGVETIDLYFAHVDDLDTPQEETLRAFAHLVQSGKVRAIGASNFTSYRLALANAFAAANSLPRYEVLQQRHTYLRPRRDGSFGAQLALTADMGEYCAAAEISIMAYSSGLGGAYSGKPDRPVPEQYLGADTDKRLLALKQIAQELGTTAHQVVFAWLANQANMMPLVAGTSIEQLTANLDAVEIVLTAEQMQRLDKAGE
jgi:aryl-alcohol dehydrogenase-like predicted oxidoreductase